MNLAHAEIKDIFRGMQILSSDDMCPLKCPLTERGNDRQDKETDLLWLVRLRRDDVYRIRRHRCTQ